ncbi:Sorting nexin, cytoplasm-to-vacuole targeting pathway/endosomal sorting [Linderina macrospora]|uniref:Sorting nexin, cytoplasm-to-vacuole targeting pathway/endosomal sorting n=1 Tax=Linderina macrospora TaxID=4868 RepID=A0ACC1JHY4_9FUNG|nr:Sorting nexin, cytoplasm-to-vacuole targeting pathway/endosomal sorting [Linderina macrospora]
MTEVDDYCCVIDRHLHELLDDANEQQRRNEQGEIGYQAPQFYNVVHINDAEKLSDNGSSFIGYSIIFGDYEVKRRYSEFESLRTCLCRLYPTFIVPPIPEKHSITQYAVLQKRAKEDQYIIERRKRMLERFLNHLVEHPILSSEHIVHRFFENGVSWTEVLHSPVVTNLPKTPLYSSPSRSPGSSIADGTSVQMPKIAATNCLAADVPVPSTLAPIRNVEARWMDCELFTNRYSNQFSGVVERSERKIYRKLGELSGDYAELGALLNGFSLLDNQHEDLAAAIEKAGQAVDSSYIEINALLRSMEADMSEPIHEYSQYAAIIKQVLRFRMLKNLQVDNTQDALLYQKKKLDTLLQADDEAKKLAQVLETSSIKDSPTTATGGTGFPGDFSEPEDIDPHGFVTPQRANTDAASSVNVPAAGSIRSRGASVSSAVSNADAYHPEFTPTLAPHSIPEDREMPLPSSSGPGLRSRSGTATSGDSLVGPGRLRTHRDSLAALGGDLDGKSKCDDDDEDDPLAQFQQEESNMWGGIGSTLPRPRARSRVRSETTEDHMAKSEFIGRKNLAGQVLSKNAREYHQNRHQQQQQQQQSATLGAGGSAAESFPQSQHNVMAASTPALGYRRNSNLLGSEGGLHTRTVPHTSPAATSSQPPPPSMASSSTFGSRLLRSPKALGDGIMNRLTYALNGMMDVDPEQMRRNQIGRASDKISVLEEQLEMLSNDLVLVNTSTQDNLDRFQKQKMREVKAILVAMSKMHLEWAEKNLEIWKEAKEAVDAVDAVGIRN